MTNNAQNKIIREYPLPTGPETVTFALTGKWSILRVEARFAKPNLYVLEDVQGPTTQADFHVLLTNEPFDAAKATGENAHLGSYLVHVPTNMLHVFGPETGGTVAVVETAIAGK